MMPHEPSNPAHDDADRAALQRAADHVDDAVVVGPWTRPEAAEVVDAELVTAEARPTYNTRRLPSVSPETRQRFADVAVTTTRVSAPVIKRAGRGLFRHVGYVGAGMADVWHSIADRTMQKDLVDAIRQARVDGDWTTVRELEETRRASATSRAERFKLHMEAVWKLAKAGLVTTAAAGAVWTAVSLGHVGTGLYQEFDDDSSGFAEVWDPWWELNTGVIDTAGDVASTLAAVSPWAAGAIGLAVLARLHYRGRNRSDLPTWLRAPDARPEASTSVEVDESMIMNALRNLGHSKLNQKFKEGWGTSIMPTWVDPPMPVGRHGWEFALRLPGGVPASSIARHKDVLAHNLGRRPEEVWVETDRNDPMAMRVFVLNPGALREPVPTYPLVDEGTTNFWTGVPIGINARREQVTATVFERNFVIAGIMGSGKTSQVQTLLAGLALDPLVDLDVFCFAENNDYDWLTPIANVQMGAGKGKVQACLDFIESRYDGLTEKGRALKDHDISSVTRAAAAQDARLRPRVIVIDECQALFRQDKAEERRKVVNMLVNFMTTARKYGEVLIFATPTPSNDSLPRDLVAVATNRACHAIGDKTRNNVVLGDKAHENGISALGLKPAVKEDGKIVELNDVGTSITIGYMHEPGLLRSYNLDADERARVVARAVELRGGPDAARPSTTMPQRERRDLLADTAAVLATYTDPVNAADVAVLLRTAYPDHQLYRELTKATLAERLKSRGVEVPKTANRYPVDPQAVRDALAAEAADDAARAADDEDDDWFDD